MSLDIFNKNSMEVFEKYDFFGDDELIDDELEDEEVDKAMNYIVYATYITVVVLAWTILVFLYDLARACLKTCCNYPKGETS